MNALRYWKGAIKKHKIKEFQFLWLDENIFKRWLAPYHQENKVLSTAYKKFIRYAKLDLIQSKYIKKIKNQLIWLITIIN